MPQESDHVQNVTVYIPGVWDLLHYGHINVLRMARQLGTRLVVGVPSDDIVVEDKGRPPVCTLFERMQMLQAIRYVSVVVPYHNLEFIEHLQSIDPQVLAVGGTWGTDPRHVDAEQWMQDHDRLFVKLPYTKGISTTEIVSRIYAA